MADLQPATPQQRNALITGGAHRIGRAITLALAQAGYGVAIHAHTSGAAAYALAREISAAGGRATVVTGDLADHTAVLALVPAATTALGPLTLLVNNVGAFEPDDFGSLQLGRFDRHLAINLRAPIFLAQAFAGRVPAGAQAAVVNILDQRVFKPTPRFFSYALSKSALESATVTMAQALAPHIRVNAVAPGPTAPNPRQEPADFARQSASVPLGHGPSPEEIAAAVVFLAGAASITGHTLPVDGGQRLAWQSPDATGVE